MQYKSIAHKIIELKNDDLELRKTLSERQELAESYNITMEQMHNRNANVLNEIIQSIGYPTIRKVGAEANEAAWLIVQHSIGQPEFMRSCAELIQNEINLGNSELKLHYAFLYDRIAVFEGKCQLYGTQFDWNEVGELSPESFDDLNLVNERRKSIGLNTLEEQTELVRRQAIDENQGPPADFMKRKREMDAWKRKVGWTQ